MRVLKKVTDILELFPEMPRKYATQFLNNHGIVIFPELEELGKLFYNPRDYRCISINLFVSRRLRIFSRSYGERQIR